MRPLDDRSDVHRMLTERRSLLRALASVIGLGGALAFFARRWRRSPLAAAAVGNDFHGQDLTGRDFRGQHLARANFSNANCTEAEFSDADLQYANLRNVNFSMAGVSNADCRHAIFDGAAMGFARGIESANYQYASFRNTDLTRKAFSGTGGTQHRSTPTHALDPVNGGADMTGADFAGAMCWHTIFHRCTLVGAHFRGANCQDADFTQADCRTVDFTDCDLRGASFTDAQTAGAIFTNARRDG